MKPRRHIDPVSLVLAAILVWLIAYVFASAYRGEAGVGAAPPKAAGR